LKFIDSLLFPAVENILKVVLTDAENAVIIAIELQTAAAAATRDHTKKLRQAMDLQGEVIQCIIVGRHDKNIV